MFVLGVAFGADEAAWLGVVGEAGGLSKDIEPAPDELADGVVLTEGCFFPLIDFGLAELVELAEPCPGRSGSFREWTDFVR